MRGYQTSSHIDPAGLAGLSPEESQVAEAVGELIAFWGFKKRHGQIWTLLFLRDTELTAKEIQDAFSLSKGGVSQLLKDLEEWRVVKRQKMPGKRAMVFVANTNLLEMIALVFKNENSWCLRRSFFL